MFTFADNTPKVLADSSLQQMLDESGYVMIPFFTDGEVADLVSFYRDMTGGPQTGFEPTTYFQDEKYRIAASEKIRNTALPHLQRHFVNYKAYMGSFIVKHADENSELGVHQDMTLVDESRYMGINIWVPLCDTTPDNGALYIIPKSHRIFPTYRNANIPNIYDQYYPEIKSYMRPLYVKAGTAVIFDNSLLHFSPANRSGDPRIAVNIFITHRDARITICYYNREMEKIELFEQEDDFFTRFTQFDNTQNKVRPLIGKCIGMVDYDFPVLTPAILRARYGKPIPGNWASRLRSIFNKIRKEHAADI